MRSTARHLLIEAPVMMVKDCVEAPVALFSTSSSIARSPPSVLQPITAVFFSLRPRPLQDDGKRRLISLLSLDS
jgi:hypothetical protein